MAYLFVKMFPYVLAAFAVGLAVGWITCTRTDDSRA